MKEKLTEGLIIKNYKVLCEEYLDVQPSAGNTKKAQLKELERYCEYHKNGNKFVIDKVFDVPKEKEDLRKFNGGDHNNIDYIKYIEALILNLLAEKETGLLFLSKYTILKELKMINENYSFCKGRIEKLSIFSNTDVDNIYEFYASTDGTLINNLEKALNNLAKRSLIEWSKEKSICECIDNNLLQIEDEVTLDEYGEEYHTYKNRLDLNYRQATDEEIQKIIYYEKEAIDYLGRKDKQDVVKNKEWKKFKKIVCDNLINYGIAFYYDSYKIIFNYEHIYKELIDVCEYLLSKKEKEDNENNLNKEIIKRLKNNISNRKNRAIDKTKKSFGISRDNTINRRLKETYIDEQYKLIELLIDKETESIKSKIRKTKLNIIEKS